MRTTGRCVRGWHVLQRGLWQPCRLIRFVLLTPMRCVGTRCNATPPPSRSHSPPADARLCGANFTNADLTYAALPSDPSMTQGCIMRAASLRNCHIPVQLIASFHSDLYGVVFSGLNLKGAKFARLDISSSNFDKCVLDGADFSECTAGE